jgi:hypothetical protein
MRDLVRANNSEAATLGSGQARHFPSSKGDDAGRSDLGAGENAKQRRLSGFVRPNDSQCLAAGKIQRRVVQNRKRAEALAMFRVERTTSEVP